MISSNQVIADFQFVGNRVCKFEFETKDINASESKAKLSFDFDYNILNIEEHDDRYVGYIEFIVIIKAKIKNLNLFKLNLIMEGAFTGNINKLDEEQFREMLELNGLTTLSQLSRAYILSVTSLSGISPSIKLPMINVIALIKQKNSSDNKD